MNRQTIILISFSVAVFLALGVYNFYKNRSSDDFRSPSAPPPVLSAAEQLKVLSTLDASHKENLTPQQKTKVLKSLTAPGE